MPGITADLLISVIPVKNHRDGWKKARILVENKIYGLDFSKNNELVRISNDFWQSIFDCLIINQNGDLLAYSTRCRYKTILNEIAFIWFENYFIEKSSLPSIKIPPKHYRTQVVRIDLLQDKNTKEFTRLRDFEQLTGYFVSLFIGKQDFLKQYEEDELEDLLLLSCLLSGFVQDDPVLILFSLTWEDVFKQNTKLSWIPFIEKGKSRRLGGIWFECSSLTRLLFLCHKYRRNSENTKKVFSFSDLKQMRKRCKKLLSNLCKKANVPPISIDILVQIERFHMRLSLSTNLSLSVITGKVKINPLSASIAGRVYEELKTGKIPEVCIGDGEIPTNDVFNPLSEETNEEFELIALEKYSKSLKDIRPYVRNFIFSPKNSDYFELNQFIATNIDSTENPNRNLAWIVKWFTEIKLKKPTRFAYWAAVIRALAYFPTLKLEEIDQDAFTGFLESDFSPSSLSLSKAAWKNFFLFLKLLEVKIPEIDWKKIRIKRKWGFVSFITPDDFNKLLICDLTLELIWAAKIAYWAGLRVSEVCRLRMCDLDIFEGRPLLYILPSKGQKRRKVSLEYLNPDQLSQLQNLVKTRLEKNNKTDTLLVDASNLPLGKKEVSEKIGTAINKYLQDKGKNIPRGRFHDFRGAALDHFYELSHDIRFSSQQAGHALPQTDCQNYQHKLDLYASLEIQEWNNPIFNKEIYLPIPVLAKLLDRERNTLTNWQKHHNIENPSIQIQHSNDLPDGERQINRGTPMLFITIQDSLRLLEWKFNKGELLE